MAANRGKKIPVAPESHSEPFGFQCLLHCNKKRKKKERSSINE